MQNKVIQSSSSKIKKEKINLKKEIVKTNPLHTNQNEINKQSSQLYIQNSPKNTSNTSNPTSSNNSNNYNTLSNNIKQITNYSGSEIKSKNTKKSCISNTNLKEIKKFDDGQNIDEKETIFGSFKNIIHYNDDKYKINKKNTKNEKNNKNSKNKDAKDLKTEKNMVKINKNNKNALGGMLYQLDSSNEIDSIEDNSHSKEEKIANTNNSNINSKKNNKNNLKLDIGTNINQNYRKRRNTIELSKIRDKKYKDYKEIKEKKKSKFNKNISEINKNKINQDEIYDELIVNDNELDNINIDTQINQLKNKEFPQMFLNPFMDQNKPINTIEVKLKNKKFISNQNICKIIKQDKTEEKSTNNHLVKTSSFATNNKSSTTNPNSSSLSGAIELLNTHNLSKNDNNNNNIEVSDSDIDKNNKYLLFLAKKGEGDKLIEFINKNNSLNKKLLDLNYHDEKGFTALHYSCNEGNLKIVEILLNAKCDPNVKNKEKETPLHFAAKKGYCDICKKLVENGALINIFNSENNSPFHYACANNYVSIVQYLLTKSPNIEVKNNYGKMPIDLVSNKEIKILFNKYLIKNKKRGVITSDTNLIDLSEKYKEEKNKILNGNIKSPKNSHNNIGFNNSRVFKKYSGSVSPLCKSPKNQCRIKKSDLNSIQDFGNDIKRENTLPNKLMLKSPYTINVEKNEIKGINTPKINNNSKKNINKANINLVLKKNELKNTQKTKEKDFSKNILINNINDKTKNETSLNKQNKNNMKNINNYCLINILKKNQTEDIFSPSMENDNDDKNNKTNLYNSINEGHDSKINNSNINESNTNRRNRNNLSTNRQNEKKKSKIKSKKEIESIKTIGHFIQNKSKFYENNLKKKKLLLDSVELPNHNLIQLNKTDEDIKNIPTMPNKSYKNQNGNNTKDTTKFLKLFETTEKIITKSNVKKMKKKAIQLKKEKKIDNSLMNNCNLSKISCKQNKNIKILDIINKSNIIDKTLDANMNNKLNLNSIEEEKITPSNFLCLAQLGKGSFGEVYLVQKKKYKIEICNESIKKRKSNWSKFIKICYS